MFYWSQCISSCKCFCSDSLFSGNGEILQEKWGKGSKIQEVISWTVLPSIPYLHTITTIRLVFHSFDHVANNKSKEEKRSRWEYKDGTEMKRVLVLLMQGDVLNNWIAKGRERNECLERRDAKIKLMAIIVVEKHSPQLLISTSFLTPLSDRTFLPLSTLALVPSKEPQVKGNLDILSILYRNGNRQETQEQKTTITVTFLEERKMYATYKASFIPLSVTA